MHGLSVPLTIPQAPHFDDRSGLAYHEFGDRDGDRLLLFNHGWPSAGSQGGLLNVAGRELGIRILAPNRPGIGGSRPHSGNRGFSDWPELVSEFFEGVGVGDREVSTLGMSGGGPYALALAHGLGSRFQHIGVVCGAGEMAESIEDVVLPYRVLGGLHRRAPWSLGAMLKVSELAMRLPGVGSNSRLAHTVANLPKRDREALCSPEMMHAVAASFSESMSGPARGVVADGGLYLTPWDFDPSEIDVPVRFWHGRLDKNITPRFAEALAEKIPTASIDWFDEEGHYSLPGLQIGSILKAMFEQD